MITLATLHKFTAQEVLDYVYTHLVTQNKASRNYENGTCMYRNPEGLKCAAGCLIADDEYAEWMDAPSGTSGTSWTTVAGELDIDAHEYLIHELQGIHDSDWYPNDPETWKQYITDFATELGLVSPVGKGDK